MLYRRTCLLQDDHSYMRDELRNISLLIPYLTHVRHARCSYISVETVFSMQSFGSTCSFLPLQNLCEKQRNLITCWQGAKPSILERFISAMVMSMLCAECLQQTDSLTVSGIYSVFCSQRMHVTLLIISTVSWASAVWIWTLDHHYVSPHLKVGQVWGQWRRRQSRRIWGWIDQSEESDSWQSPPTGLCMEVCRTMAPVGNRHMVSSAPILPE